MKLSLQQYRWIDVTIMTVLLMIAEAVIVTAARVWFPSEVYVLSPTAAIVCIVMMRWGGYAAIPAMGGGLALCLASGAQPRQFLVYGIGNVFALLALFLLRRLGKARVQSNVPLTLLFTCLTFCGMQTGRGLVGLLLGEPPARL